ncbi:hypothetical protein [Thermococcus sp.]|uniref:hypothetical protein n=1 Tax=Thermococcus sp. TaxID=35749 RepID=UPI0026196525|nr:hypothetical protein [Thermococcus sp.]
MVELVLWLWVVVEGALELDGAEELEVVVPPDMQPDTKEANRITPKTKASCFA